MDLLQYRITGTGMVLNLTGPKSVVFIQIWFDLIRFREDISVCMCGIGRWSSGQ